MAAVTTITAASIVQLRGDAAVAEVDGDFIVMGIQQGKIFGFNEVGNGLWPKLAEPVAVSDLCDALALEYQADVAVIRQDVIRFLEDLAENGFLAVH